MARIDADENKRREQRVPTLGVIVHFLPPSGELNPLFEGLIFNLSSSGAGVISVNPVEVGDTVKVTSSAISGVPRDARVQWCSHISGNLYKFGLALN